ncbi:hypothetical protein BEP68_17780 [Microbacterium sp. 4-7]|nr:hypothetical protein [Microbacterium sp. 4-7]
MLFHGAGCHVVRQVVSGGEVSRDCSTVTTRIGTESVHAEQPDDDQQGTGYPKQCSAQAHWHLQFAVLELHT